MSSISNPFFFDPSPSQSHHQQLVLCSSGAGQCPASSIGGAKQKQQQLKVAGAQQQQRNEEEDEEAETDADDNERPVEEVVELQQAEGAAATRRQQQQRRGWKDNDKIAGDSRQRQQQQKQQKQSCCVANPFTEQGTCHFESRMSQSMMDSLLSMCSSAEYPNFLSASTCSSSSVVPATSSTGNDGTAAAAMAFTATIPPHSSFHGSFTSKLLQDSGYRSGTSNSALEEELAMVEQRRRAEREQRRQQRQQQRKQLQQQEKLRPRIGSNLLTSSNTFGTGNGSNPNPSSSSVPAFLRRTCSSAATGFSAAIRPPAWVGNILPTTTNNNGGVGTTTNCSSAFASSLFSSVIQRQQRQNFSAPRRTRSVGGSSHYSLAAATASSIQLPPAYLYSTGWMVEADMSGDDATPPGSGGSTGAAAKKDDCTVELSGNRRLGIERLRELLCSRFCFISGLRTVAGHPVLTFPDSRASGAIDFEDYQLLLDYLFQTQRDEELPSTYSQQQQQQLPAPPPEWVLIVDRRQDRWSSVRTLLTFLLSYFPLHIHLVLLLKPEGVLQRAIEYGGYRTLLDGCEEKFRVLVCQNCAELRDCLGADSLTMDLGGSVRHNHQEWVAHRIDIERMKSSARVIAESLTEFGRCLRETELPNDVHSTERILELQQQERDAIKEDFRISIRKGMQLLQQVRQIDQTPFSEQLSPSRLQNVTAIERMIAQLQDTEKSFDMFWLKHRKRLLGCLQLRRFEDEFRKLQHSFAKHMLRLEEHREVGNSESSAERLSREHRDYQAQALADVGTARALRQRGLDELGGRELAELLNTTQGSDSVGPKCEELRRMADALEEAMERRAQVLEQSRQMHAQIGKANDWCRRGVELLSIAPLDLLSAGCSNNLAIYEHALGRLNDFIAEGDQLDMDALVRAATAAMAHQQQQQKKSRCKAGNDSSNNNKNATAIGAAGCDDGGGNGTAGLAILFSTTEASSLLAQVNERIDDIRRLSRARQDALRKLSAERRAQQQQQQQQFGSNDVVGNGPAAPETPVVVVVGGGAERRRQLNSGGNAGSRERPVQVVTPEKQPQQQQQQPKKNETSNNGKQHRHKDKQNNGTNGKCCSSPASSSTASSPTTPNGTADGQLVRTNSTTSTTAGGCNCSPGTMASSMLAMNGVPGDGNTGNGTRNGNNSKVDFVLDELLSTERNYVKELAEILCHYVQPFEALEVNGSSQLPAAFRGQADILFGNIRELHDFHHSMLLPALLQQHAAAVNANASSSSSLSSVHSSSVEAIAAVLSAQRQRLLALYRTYCRNKPMSEALRAEHGTELNKFFMECQRRAGHLLPLSAYLLKPVQRITKYQLLLKELIRHCPDADQQQSVVHIALAQMLDVLAQINADMEQLHILGYPGDLRLLGPLRLQSECAVFVYKRSKSASVGSNGGGAAGAATAGGSGISGNSRRGGLKGKHQKRHLFLFDGGVLFCKKRVQTVHFASEYYEHKQCIPMHTLGFAECSRQNEDRFELWDQQTENVGYAIQPVDERARQKWIQRLARLTVLLNQQQQKIAEAAAMGGEHHQHRQQQHNNQMMMQSSIVPSSFYHPPPSPSAGSKTPRPQSWTTTSSSDDGITISSGSNNGTAAIGNTDACIGVGNGNGSVGGGGSSNSVHSNRSSTSSTRSSCCSSSAVIFDEEKCQQNIIGQPLSQSAADQQQHVLLINNNNTTPTAAAKVATATFFVDHDCSTDFVEKLQQQQSDTNNGNGEQQQRSQSQPPMLLETADARY